MILVVHFFLETKKLRNETIQTTPILRPHKTGKKVCWSSKNISKFTYTQRTQYFCWTSQNLLSFAISDKWNWVCIILLHQSCIHTGIYIYNRIRYFTGHQMLDEILKTIVRAEKIKIISMTERRVLFLHHNCICSFDSYIHMFLTRMFYI